MNLLTSVVLAKLLQSGQQSNYPIFDEFKCTSNIILISLLSMILQGYEWICTI